MIFITAILIIHAIIVSKWISNFRKVKKVNVQHKHKNNNQSLELLTVIIACKNEENSLPTLLSSLKDQTTPPHEIIIIDDNSTDSTKEIASEFTVLENEGSGKKDAIRTGIKHCKTDWAITTDADVVVPKTWINSISIAASYTSASALIGPVKISPISSSIKPSVFSSILNGAERLDYAALMGWSISTALYGNAAMGSAANFAIKKTDYPTETEMKSHLASGDDVFAIHHLVSLGKKVFAVSDPESCVEAGSAGSIKNWMRQRARWGAKAQHYSNPEAIKTSYWIAIIGLSQLTTLVLLLVDFSSTIIPLTVLWVGRASIDIIFTRKVALWFQISTPILSWLFLAITYPFQIPIVFIYSVFFKSKWR